MLINNPFFQASSRTRQAQFLLGNSQPMLPSAFEQMLLAIDQKPRDASMSSWMCLPLPVPSPSKPDVLIAASSTWFEASFLELPRTVLHWVRPSEPLPMLTYISRPGGSAFKDR